MQCNTSFICNIEHNYITCNSNFYPTLRCRIRLSHVHYTTDTTNVEIHRIVAEHTGKYGTLLEVIKKKLRWFGHNYERAKGTLAANSILQGKVEGI